MYKEYHPAPALSRYIDAYWMSNVDTGGAVFVQRILPDTCTDIICNLGADLHATSIERSVLKADSCYLLGTMTRYSDVTVAGDTKVFGIRFKPFGMHALLGFSLPGTSNKRQELGKRDFNFKEFITANGIPDLAELNRFFIDRLPRNHTAGFHTMEHIVNAGGRLSISELAVRCHTTERQLERVFREQAGVTVKELSSQVRLLRTIKALKAKNNNDSLLGLALDAGFYDHAHLSNNIRKYTGHAPSHFMK